MMKSIKVASSIVVGALAMLAGAKDAHALGPVSIEIGARAGVATNPADAPSPNPLGFGIGARGGIEITNFYVGASFLYYLGATQSTPLGDASLHTLLYGLEGGSSRSARNSGSGTRRLRRRTWGSAARRAICTSSRG